MMSKKKCRRLLDKLARVILKVLPGDFGKVKGKTRSQLRSSSRRAEVVEPLRLEQVRPIEETAAQRRAREDEDARRAAAEQLSREAAEQRQAAVQQEREEWARHQAEVKRLREKQAGQAAEAERLENERKAKADAEARRQAEEAEKAELARQAAEAERLENERKAEAEARRQAEEAEKAEQARQAAEAERLENERKAKAKAEAEARRQAEEAEKAELARQAAEAERLENERKAKAKAEAEARRQAEEAEKAEQARQAAEAERLENERKAKAKAEAEARRQAEEAEKAELARQAAEAERLENERKAKAKAEAEARRQAEEAEKAEQARQAAEAERLENERKAKAKAEAEARRQGEEAEKAEQARQAAEAERLENERKAKAKAEAEARRQAEEAEKAEQARQAAEAEARRPEEEDKKDLSFSEGLDRERSSQWQVDVEAQSEPLAEQRDKADTSQEHQHSQVGSHDWRQWKEGDWNRCLLRYCFLSSSDSDTRVGVPSSPEDLRFAVGDPQANPSELADAFVKSIINQAERHNTKPAKYFTKRADNWNPDTPLEPPFFAFLWATCLISQGYPNPYETGQFHMRYQRVFGHEPRSTFRSLKLGWEKLSEWLEQERALGGEEHRELILPTELGNRTNIGYSWHLSFPSRSDRAELASVIQDLLDDGIAVVPPTEHTLFAIKRSGRFGAEFTRTLDKQIRVASKTGVVDDWFAGIIRHEQSQLQFAADNRPSASKRSSRYSDPDLSLQLNLEDPSQIELVLPSQELTGLEKSNLSVTFCTLDPVGTEHSWDPQKGIASIGEDICQEINEMAPAWTWKLRSGSSGGYTLKRWSCAGLEPGDIPILCFCTESGQRLTGNPIISESSEAWFFAPKTLQLILNESVEVLDELRWGVSLKGWRGYLLRLTQPRVELLWQGVDESGTQQTLSLTWSFLANVTPILRGRLIDKHEKAYMSSPSLWIPPLSVPVKLMLAIKDLRTGQLLSDTSEPVMLPASNGWTEVDLTECIETESKFSILVQPEQDHPDLPSRWRTTFQVRKPFEHEGNNELVSPQLTRLDSERFMPRSMDAEFRPFAFEVASDFWLARWLLERVWPAESLDLTISNGIDSCADTIIADQEGTLIISAAVYRYTLQGEADTLSIAVRRQGEQTSYVLATAGEELQSFPQTNSTMGATLSPQRSSPASPKSSPSRGRPVDFVITFQPRFTGKNAKKQIADFTSVMKQLIAEAGIPADELHPQNLDNDVWIRLVNQDHLSEIDDLLEEAGKMCRFKILKQKRR